MDFFGIGSMELLLIILIAFLVFGPRKLPEVMKGFGKAMNSFKKGALDITNEVNRELKEVEKDSEEAKRPNAVTEKDPPKTVQTESASKEQAHSSEQR